VVLGFDRQLRMLKDMIKELNKDAKSIEIKIAKSETEDERKENR
jgi:hypothetical protein